MLVVNTGEISLGDLPKNSIKEFQFSVTNLTNNVVSVMLNVSCGCTVPNISPNPIPAHGSAIVKATFDTTGKTGFQKKSIYIDFMEGNEKKQLKVDFRANVLN